MSERIWTLEHWGLHATILAILGFFAFRLLRVRHSPARHPLFPSRGMDIHPDRITLDPDQTPQHVPLADIAYIEINRRGENMGQWIVLKDGTEQALSDYSLPPIPSLRTACARLGIPLRIAPAFSFKPRHSPEDIGP